MMSSLEKIADSIIEEAEQRANGIVAEANKKAKGISEHAAQDVEKFRENHETEIQQKLMEVEKRFASENRRKRSQALLKARGDIIDKIVQQAKSTIENLPEEEYFEFLKQICIKRALKGDGKLYFAKLDYERLPEDFVKTCNEHIEEGTVVLEGINDTINHGFVIVYDRVEQNCSIDSMFEFNKDLLWDTVNAHIYDRA